MRRAQNGKCEGWTEREFGGRLFDWFKRMRMKNVTISGTILKEKVISYAQELKVEEFHASN